MDVQSEILVLSVAYALLGVLLLVGVTRTRLPWAIKAATIVVTSAFYVVAFFRTEGLLGWSATAALPDRFQLLAARIVDPDPSRHEPGAVHLWVEALDEANLPSGQPRAYRLQYSRRLAHKAEAAKAELELGHPQGGRAVDIGTEVDETVATDDNFNAPKRAADPGGDASTGNLDPAFLGGDSKSVDFAPLPRATLPEKEGP